MNKSAPIEPIRMQKMAKAVSLCLGVPPSIFFLQIAAWVYAIPIFREMFVDFGSYLPSTTKFVMEGRFLWLLLALVILSYSIFVLRSREFSRRVALLVGAMGFLQFLLAQFITVAMFLPVFILGAVSSNGE